MYICLLFTVNLLFHYYQFHRTSYHYSFSSTIFFYKKANIGFWQGHKCIFVKSVALDTGRKFNVHKTFRRRPGRSLNVLCTFNLHPVPRGVLSTKNQRKHLGPTILGTTLKSFKKCLEKCLEEAFIRFF